MTEENVVDADDRRRWEGALAFPFQLFMSVSISMSVPVSVSVSVPVSVSVYESVSGSLCVYEYVPDFV